MPPIGTPPNGLGFNGPFARQLRLQCGIRAEEVAVALRISAATVYRSEQGVSAMTLPIACAWASFLGRQINDLLAPMPRGKAA